MEALDHRGATVMIGVVADHDSEVAELLLDNLTAWMLANPGMPLLPKKMVDDCLVAPPERNNVHVEIRWLYL